MKHFWVVTSGPTQHAMFAQMLDRPFDANQFGVLFREDPNSLSLSETHTHTSHLPTLLFHSLFKSAPPLTFTVFILDVHPARMLSNCRAALARIVSMATNGDAKWK